jgi:SAM-dependent methyltransferase
VTGSPARPFYGRFAWAYDLLSDRPVATECAQIAAILRDRGVAPDAPVLDAGCGTGRYTAELDRLGYRMTGLDASADLVAVARARAAAPTFIIADLTALPSTPRYDAILCRGVLNDLVEDDTRRDAFRAFARALGRGGVLVLDVRDWEESVRRKTREPVREKTVVGTWGRLTFRSETRLDHATRQLRIAERHTLTTRAGTTTADHDFTMRCWTRDELDTLLAGTGFTATEYRGAYDEPTPVGTTDRLVVIAGRP